ncbi:MAG TPA: hypothetical protein PLZ79_13595, partial [Burkholderiales bacterium]|nr:hypothetical protein [Burkholderiales bacterium]
MTFDLFERARRTASRNDRGRTIHTRGAATVAREVATLRESGRHSQRHAGGAGHQRHIRARRADDKKIGFVDRIHDHQAFAPGRALRQGFAQFVAAALDRRDVDKAHFTAGLAPQPATQIRVRHGVQWVVPQTRLAEQAVAHEQVPAEDAPSDGRKCRAGDDTGNAQFVRQGFADRSDVSVGGRIERRA